MPSVHEGQSYPGSEGTPPARLQYEVGGPVAPGLRAHRPTSARYVVIHTDGSCLGNPGPGGWAFYAPYVPYHQSGYKLHTTNNEMELEAIRQALRWVNNEKRWQVVGIRSDSQWALRVITGEYKAQSHLELLEDIRSLMRLLTCHYLWVPSHNPEYRHQVLVDSLARAAAREAQKWVR